MVVQALPGKEKPGAPYASPGHILGILTRYRDRGLPPVLGVEVVEDALGITKVYAYRTLDTLQFLGFLDDKNHPQPVFHRLQELSDDEYKAALAEQLHQAYSRLFENLDPAKDNEQQLRDHFRRYEPPSQTARQYQLFRSLCIAAGLIEGKAIAATKGSRPKTPQSRLKGTSPLNRGQSQDNPPPPPATDDDVRRLLAEALIEKIREVDAGDWDTVQKYLGEIRKLTEPAQGAKVEA